MDQIWTNANQEFKMVFIKYRERIINGKLIEFEMMNICIALTRPLAKDKEMIYVLLYFFL